MPNLRILTASMDNVLASKLSNVATAMAAVPPEQIGDAIDRGLILRRLLEEAGFGLVVTDETIPHTWIR